MCSGWAQAGPKGRAQERPKGRPHKSFRGGTNSPREGTAERARRPPQHSRSKQKPSSITRALARSSGREDSRSPGQIGRQASPQRRPPPASKPKHPGEPQALDREGAQPQLNQRLRRYRAACKPNQPNARYIKVSNPDRAGAQVWVRA